MKLAKLAVIVALVTQGTVLAADQESAKTDSSAVQESTQTVKKRAKIDVVKPKNVSNWSKIKDLFM